MNVNLEDYEDESPTTVLHDLHSEIKTQKVTSYLTFFLKNYMCVHVPSIYVSVLTIKPQFNFVSQQL